MVATRRGHAVVCSEEHRGGEKQRIAHLARGCSADIHTVPQEGEHRHQRNELDPYHIGLASCDNIGIVGEQVHNTVAGHGNTAATTKLTATPSLNSDRTAESTSLLSPLP